MADSELVPCPLCGTDIRTGLYRCPQCTGELRPAGQPQGQRSLSAGGVFGAVLGALVVVVIGVWVITSLASANDDLECSVENADRAVEGRPLLDCGD